MNMDDNLVRRVKACLKTQCYMMNDSWLRDCIEYYTGDHPNATQAQIVAFVTSQWQLSDLREINNENGCLPAGLAQQKSATLAGRYILQMEKMYDISKSKYSQLDKIRNVSNENIQETETNKPQAWEPKGKRMMQLHLTDGVQEVSAIEYRPIRFLMDAMLPGYKVMITGPVMCRRGVIMLEEKNFKEIGGEVESLLKVNALENVLARALDMEENPDPYNDKQQNTNQENVDVILEDDFDIDFEELTQIERQGQLEVNPQQTQNTDNSANSRIGPSCTVTRCVTESTTRNPYISVPREGTKSGSASSIKNYFQTTVKENSDEFPDDDDVLLAMIDVDQINVSATSNQNSGNLFRNTGSHRKKTEYRPIPLIAQPKAECDQQGAEPFTIEEMETENAASVQDNVSKRANAITKLQSSKASSTDNDLKRVPDRTWRNSVAQNEKEKTSRTQNEVVVRNKLTNPNNFFFNPADAVPQIPDDDFNFDAIPDAPSFVTPERAVTKINSPKMSLKPTNNGNSPRSLPSTSGCKRTATAITPPVNSPPKIKCVQDTPKLSKVNRKITEFTRKILPPEDVPQKICDFICDVIKETVTGPAVYRTVRGKVTKLSALSKRGDSWYLEATVTDGTGSLDVTFASEILERILGFSVAEFTEKKKMKKTNPEIVDHLRKGFRIAEGKLNKLDAFLEMELSQNKAPNVVLIKELTNEQKELIDKRIKMLAI